MKTVPDKIYVIHYTKLQDRLEKLLPILQSSSIPYEIISEYDKETITDDILAEKFDSGRENFDKKIQGLWDSRVHRYRELNMPEISCTLKHFSALEKLGNECPNYGMIIEDDIFFEEDFSNKFEKLIQETPLDWDSVFLGEGCGVPFIRSRLTTAKRVTDGVYLVDHPATNCAECYLVKPEMAKKLAQSLPFSLVSDWEISYQLFKHDAKVFWWVPPLASQGSKNGTYKSELDMGQRG